MTDMLIRDVPDEVIAALDAHAGRLGLSRSEYVRRRLAQDAAASGCRAVGQPDRARPGADHDGSRLEVAYSGRSGPDLRAGFRRPPLASMPVEYLTPAIEDRAGGDPDVAGRPGSAPRSLDPGPADRGDRGALRAHGPPPRQGLRGDSRYQRTAGRAAECQRTLRQAGASTGSRRACAESRSLLS